MNLMDIALTASALLFFISGVWTLVWWVRRPRVTAVTRRGVVEEECSNCARTMIFERATMRKLSPPELALAVRGKLVPAGTPLLEHTCPYCEAAHVFTVEGKELKWIAADIDTPQAAKNRCQECKQPIAPAPWPKGEWDGKVLEAPGMRMDMGLKCPRCGAVCCVNCTHDFTRNRAPKGEFLCPRCGRGPMNEFWHG